MEKVAIIGTGIAGMGCGRFLHKKYDLTLFEQNNYVGGHTNTITVDEDGSPVYMYSFNRAPSYLQVLIYY